MKKLLLAASLLIATLTTQAQSITNNTACDIQFMQVCFSPACWRTPSPNIVVPAGTVMPLPPCGGPSIQTTYVICWVNCPGVCTYVNGTPGSSPCINWPIASNLPACAPCGPAGITVDLAGNILVQ